MLLARLADGNDLSGARQRLSAEADFLRQFCQTHRFYPVLRYFHYREPHYALPRILLTALDSATLLRSTLDPERHARVIHAMEVDELFEAAMSLLHELMPGVQRRPPSAEDAVRWRQRYLAALARLADAGLEVRADVDAGADDYVARRPAWDRPVHELAADMLYEWDASERTPAM